MTNQQFLKLLDAEFRSFSEDEPAHASCLIVLMVDHWQDLREEYGVSGLLSIRHQLGKRFQQHFESVRALTALSPTTLVGLVNGSDADGLRNASRDFFEQIKQSTFDVHKESLSLTLSTAFCPFDLRFSQGGQMLVEALQQAELLQHHGGNNWVEVRASISSAQASQDGRRMLNLLMQSLRNDSVRVVFQPLLATDSGQKPGFQMLPRLKADDDELIAAADFLPVAQSAGLVGTLDRWMIRRAILELKARNGAKSIRLFINQSDELLVKSERRDQLVRQLESAGSQDGNLVLEFHLSDAMSHLGGTEALIALAGKSGLQICLSMVDAHSNWALLSGRLRCDYLRMSPAFVRQIVGSDNLAEDLDRLTESVRAAGTRIIMPMIEDAGMAANLWRSGVDYLQGNVIQAAEESIRLND